MAPLFGTGGFDAWARYALKGESFHPSEVLEALTEPPTESTDDPERRAIGREVLDRIRIDLTEAEWIVLRTCTGDLSDEAAASYLETTPAAIRIRRTRLRAKLRIHLEEGT